MVASQNLGSAPATQELNFDSASDSSDAVFFPEEAPDLALTCESHSWPNHARSRRQETTSSLRLGSASREASNWVVAQLLLFVISSVSWHHNVQNFCPAQESSPVERNDETQDSHNGVCPVCSHIMGVRFTGAGRHWRGGTTSPLCCRLGEKTVISADKQNQQIERSRWHKIDVALGALNLAILHGTWSSQTATFPGLGCLAISWQCDVLVHPCADVINWPAARDVFSASQVRSRGVSGVTKSCHHGVSVTHELNARWPAKPAFSRRRPRRVTETVAHCPRRVPITVPSWQSTHHSAVLAESLSQRHPGRVTVTAPSSKNNDCYSAILAESLSERHPDSVAAPPWMTEWPLHCHLPTMTLVRRQCLRRVCLAPPPCVFTGVLQPEPSVGVFCAEQTQPHHCSTPIPRRSIFTVQTLHHCQSLSYSPCSTIIPAPFWLHHSCSTVLAAFVPSVTNN